MKNDSKIEVKIKCGSCSNSDILTTILSPYENSKQLSWTCSECGMKKTIIIKKAEKEVEKEKDVVSSLRYKMDKDGKKIVLDDMGNPLEKKIITIQKRKEKELMHGNEVEEI